MANINKIKLSGTSYDIQDSNAARSVTLTQAEYDALVTGGTVDPNTFYVISDSEYSFDGYWTSAQTQSAITQSVSGKADTSAVTSVSDSLTAHTANTTVHVTANEKSTWNAKSDFSGNYNDLTNKPTIPTVPTNVSDFTNDAGYITSDDISGKTNQSDFTAHTANTTAHVTQSEKNTWNAKSDFSGNYNDLSNKPTIPTSASQLTNDAGYITSSALDGYATTGDVQTATNDMATKTWVGQQGYLTQHQDISGKQDVSGMTAYTETSAFTAHTADTTVHVTANEKSTWNAKSDFSGSYNDLTNKLSAGTNITIVDNVISAEGGGSDINVVQTTGTSTTDVMSQDAVTTQLNNKTNKSAAVGGYKFGNTNNTNYLQYTNANRDNIGNSIYYPTINGKGILTNNSTWAQNNYNFQLVETSAITTSITSSSTDAQVPSAKAVYDAIQEGASGTVDQTIISGSTNAVAGGAVYDKFDEVEQVTARALNELNEEVSEKQDTLVSGTNIKTINNESILGSGNIDIQGGSTYTAGRGISIANDTISFNLPISAGTGTNSVIEGSTSNFARGNYAHAEGSNTKASGQYSHAEGYLSEARGEGSHAEGTSTSTKYYSHGEGSATFAVGNYSHAEGDGTTAATESSHAEGRYTITKNNAEHASGQYNVSSKASNTFGDSGNTLFSVGNGTSNSARHNAFEIRQNGDIYLTKDGQDVKLQDQLGGSSITVDTALDSGSTNPVENRVIYNKIDEVEQVTAAALNELNDAFGGLKLMKISQTDYDNLQVKDQNTLYIIVN